MKEEVDVGEDGRAVLIAMSKHTGCRESVTEFGGWWRCFFLGPSLNAKTALPLLNTL